MGRCGWVVRIAVVGRHRIIIVGDSSRVRVVLRPRRGGGGGRRRDRRGVHSARIESSRGFDSLWSEDRQRLHRGQLRQQGGRLDHHPPSIHEQRLDVHAHGMPRVHVYRPQHPGLHCECIQVPQGLQVELVVDGAGGVSRTDGQQQTGRGQRVSAQRVVASSQEQQTCQR